jgi:hypothetical protein
MIGPGTGPVPAYGTGAQPVAPAKSKLGLVIGLIVAVAIAGIAVFVVLNKNGGGKGPVAGNDGSAHGVVPPAAVDAGQIAATPPDAAQVAAAVPDAALPAVAIDAGQVALTIDAAAEPATETVRVLLMSRNGVDFEAYENGAKVVDGPGDLEVTKGQKRTVVIKAKGFKDKTLVIEGDKKRVQFTLDRNASQVVPVHSTPTGPNCANVIVDPRSKACVAQYCAKHPEDESKCGLE